MANTLEPDETRAIAIAGMSLGLALAAMLKRMDVLDPESIEKAFEAALSALENTFPPEDRSAALARQLVDLMGATVSSGREADRIIVRVG
jgi:hypothetical protein